MALCTGVWGSAVHGALASVPGEQLLVQDRSDLELQRGSYIQGRYVGAGHCEKFGLRLTALA